MELPRMLYALEIFMFVFMPACGFFLIPAAFKSYQKWRVTERPRHFSSMIIQSAISLSFLTSIFPLFASRIIKLFSLSNPWFYGFLCSLVLGYFLGYWTLPKMLSSYKKFKVDKTPAHLTLMVFFVFLSFYGLSTFFILMFHSAVLR